MYDYLIVGGGPAGAACARLIDPKYSVMLINKENKNGAKMNASFPALLKTQKPCGGLLSSDAQKELAVQKLTVPAEIYVNPQISFVRTVDLEKQIFAEYRRNYINIDRAAFDRWLLSLVPESVTVETGTVTAITPDENGYSVRYCRDGEVLCVKAKNILGADGADSKVRKTFFPSVKVPHYTAIQQWFLQKTENPFYSCVFDEKTSESCSWSLNKGDYFIYGGAFSPKNCKKSFEEQKSRAKKMGYIFSEPILTEACTVLSPRRFSHMTTGSKSVFLIGEAAGFISPSSFEGISRALKSGRLLAEAINENAEKAHILYKKKAFPLKLSVVAKMLKYPFMYSPFLRKTVLIFTPRRRAGRSD